MPVAENSKVSDTDDWIMAFDASTENFYWYRRYVGSNIITSSESIVSEFTHRLTRDTRWTKPSDQFLVHPSARDRLKNAISPESRQDLQILNLTSFPLLSYLS